LTHASDQRDPPGVTVGIVSYNSLTYLPGCLASLAAQTYPAFEILVADNASTDGSAAWLENQKPDIHVFFSDRNIGFATAHNALIRVAAGRYYLALNPDVVLDGEFIARLVDALGQHPEAGWACGKTLHMTPAAEPTGTIYSAGHAVLRDGYAFNIGAGEADRGQYDSSREVFGANGAAALYRREMLDDVQDASGEFFDESMFLFYEDVDLDWRAHLLSWRCLYVPQAAAHHTGGYSGAGSDPALTAQGLGNRYLSVFKNSFAPDFIINLPVFVAHVVLRLLTGPHSGVVMLRTLLAGLASAYRKRRAMSKRRRIDRSEMLGWFEWSVSQRGDAVTSASGRFWRYIRR
jgi:GT2 family glycosyltransferase